MAMVYEADATGSLEEHIKGDGFICRSRNPGVKIIDFFHVRSSFGVRPLHLN